MGLGPKLATVLDLVFYFQFSLIFLASVSAAPTSDKCCSEKKVGDILYTLAESDMEKDTSKFGCKDGCVYKADEDPVDRFCFKDGNLPVTCLDGEVPCVVYILV